MLTDHVVLVSIDGLRANTYRDADNEPFEPILRTGRWVWETAALRTPTLWDVLRARGGTSAAISWPVTVGADIDWNVPDVWLPEDPGSIAPIRGATRPLGLFDEFEREATGG